MIAVSGAAQTPYYKTKEDIERISYNPPLSKFSFAKRKIIEMTNAALSKIDTTSVYFVKDNPQYKEEEDSAYTMYRFYSNGRVFISSALDIRASKADTVLLDTTYGNWGMYKIEGNNLVVQGWFKVVVPHYYRLTFKILPNKGLMLIKTAGGKLGLTRWVRIKIPVYRKPYKMGKLPIWHEGD